mmetsp:Transcript_95881/g.213286  ORF Transcript_95881/g.213286 Transcript_95881/m.213286 type:complete len:346 (+) Transcript_95881:105-1142(+)
MTSRPEKAAAAVAAAAAAAKAAKGPPGAAGKAPETRPEALREVVLAANADGVDLLRRGRPDQAFEQLKFAEAVLAANPGSGASCELLALTCSNLGCYYRKAGLPRSALRYLGRALRAEETSARRAPQDAISVATTKLNACAALSGVGNHEGAERLAVEASHILVRQQATSPSSREACTLLAVACHNLGAEREHLGQWASAAVAFRQGSQVACRSLGPGSPLARSLAESCGEALGKAERNPVLLDQPASPASATYHSVAGRPPGPVLPPALSQSPRRRCGTGERSGQAGGPLGRRPLSQVAQRVSVADPAIAASATVAGVGRQSRTSSILPPSEFAEEDEAQMETC